MRRLNFVVLRKRMEPIAIYSTKAEDYAAHRPDYARKAISALVELTRLDSTWVVADIGSGTGNLSRHLVGHTRWVFAIEPNDAMRHQAEHLLGGYTSFKSIVGTAEQTTLPNHIVDLITVGQALHWFDGPCARREFARILKPCGLLAVLWNQFDGSEQPNIDYYFAPGTYERRTFPVSIRETWEGFIGGARSAANAPVRGEPDYDDFEKTHRRIFNSQARDGLVEVSYATELVVGLPRDWPAEQNAAADADSSLC